MSNDDIKSRIEKIMSDIFSEKYKAKINIKFVKEEISIGNNNKTGDIRKK